MPSGRVVASLLCVVMIAVACERLGVATPPAAPSIALVSTPVATTTPAAVPPDALATTSTAGATSRPTPKPTLGPSPSPTATKSSLPSWRRIATLARIGDVQAFTADPEGYLLVEETDSAKVARRSSDGRTWKRISVPATPGCPPSVATGQEAETCDVWATPSGWEAFSAEPGNPSLWRSVDGTRWQAVALPDDIAGTLVGSAWTGSDGRTLLLLDPTGASDPDHETLGVIGSDGSWRPVVYPSSCPEPGAGEVSAPGPVGPNVWIVTDGTNLCVSSDLSHWRAGRFPPIKGACPVHGPMWTRFGILALSVPDDPTCEGVYEWLSPDGLRWTRLPTAVEAWSVADGPAGVLGIVDINDSHQIWQLRR